MSRLSQYEALMKQYNKSLTAERRTIFLTILQNDRLTMAQLIKQHPTINRSSVYRIVKLFESIGIIQRIHFGFKHSFELSEVFRAHHHHLHCVQCDRIQPTGQSKSLENSIIELAAAANFIPTNHILEISGICQKCAKTKETPGRSPGSMEASHFHI